MFVLREDVSNYKDQNIVNHLDGQYQPKLYFVGGLGERGEGGGAIEKFT